MDAFKLLTRAYFDGADLVDEVEAALEIKDFKGSTSTLAGKLGVYRSRTAQVVQAAGDHYARDAQERLLLRIFKHGMTAEAKLELRRFLESRMEYFRDADHWQEAFELLVAEDAKKE